MSGGDYSGRHRPPAPDLRAQVAVIEHRTLDLVDEVRALRDTLDAVDSRLTVLVTQRDEAEKGREREHRKLEKWKTAGLSVLGGLALALIGWLAKIALAVQTARVLPGP